MAQESQALSSPPYQSPRYEEDYRYLRNPARRNDLWDLVKYIPLNDKGDRYVSLGGEIRLRYEYFATRTGGADRRMVGAVSAWTAASEYKTLGGGSYDKEKILVSETVEAQMRERTNWGALLSPQERAKGIDSATSGTENGRGQWRRRTWAPKW
jgi:hypothetical protein